MSELSVIEEEIRRIQKENDERYVQLEKLNEQKHLLLLNKLAESKWLKDSLWKLEIHNEIFIKLIRSPIKSLVKDLRLLFDVSWHSSVDLNEDLELGFNDNEIVIRFDNKSKSGLMKLVEFINFHELKISLSEIDFEINRIEKLKLMKDELTSTVKNITL